MNAGEIKNCSKKQKEIYHFVIISLDLTASAFAAFSIEYTRLEIIKQTHQILKTKNKTLKRHHSYGFNPWFRSRQNTPTTSPLFAESDFFAIIADLTFSDIEEQIGIFAPYRSSYRQRPLDNAKLRGPRLGRASNCLRRINLRWWWFRRRSVESERRR